MSVVHAHARADVITKGASFMSSKSAEKRHSV